MKVAVGVVTILVSAGCCALIAWVLYRFSGWSRIEALLGAVVYGVAVLGAQRRP